MPAPILAALSFVVIASQESAAPRDPTPDELEAGWTAFLEAPAETQRAVVKEIAARVETTDDADLKRLLALRDRAARELALKPARPRPFHDPATYGVRVRREAVDPASADAAEKRELFKPWENAPPLAARVTFDLARDEAIDSGTPLSPAAQLENVLNGYAPGADLLVAWLEKRFDFDAKLNPRLVHFDHLYCDLNGRSYPEVTIYDAFASGSSMDMPDVDVIAYARVVLKDDSFVSPIPPDARRQKLYEQVGDGFLACFRYRVWIEAAANLFVRPEAPLRGTHEGLRSRMLELFALEEGDVDRVARRLETLGDRGGFLAEMDERLEKEPALARKSRRFCEERAAEQWAVARAAYGVLRERGLLAR